MSAFLFKNILMTRKIKHVFFSQCTNSQELAYFMRERVGRTGRRWVRKRKGISLKSATFTVPPKVWQSLQVLELKKNSAHSCSRLRKSYIFKTYLTCTIDTQELRVNLCTKLSHLVKSLTASVRISASNALKTFLNIIAC